MRRSPTESMFWMNYKEYVVEDKEKHMLYMRDDAPERAKRSLEMWKKGWNLPPYYYKVKSKPV